MLEHLLEKLGRRETCPVTNIRDGCVTFIRGDGYIRYLVDTDKDVWVITSKDTLLPMVPDNVKFYFVDDPDYAFVIYHNEVYKNMPAPRQKVGKNCKIHPSVIMDVPGLKVVYAPDGSRVQIKHIGNVVVGDNVEIGPYTVVHRATLESTIIGNGVKIGAKNNIAHNNIIGDNTVFAAGAITNGSVTIGKDCWIGSGAMIKNGISICDNVVVGMGAVVVKDIVMPGIYAGNPARYLKPVKKGWNF